MNEFLLLAAGAGWPSMEEWTRVLSLRDHNTRVVVFGTTLLGMAAGVIGSFTLLRKRALMGDALSHATLPGIAIAFLLCSAVGLVEKSLPFLLAGAAVTGVMGVGVILFIRRYTRLKEDTALGVVLSVFFGGGVVLLDIVQQLGTGSAAGLESFIYGKTASMVPGDVMLIGATGVVVAVCCGLLFKEFKLICFDPAYASVQGWPVLLLDVMMMALVIVVTVVGLQAVGLILVIALLIIPAAAARFWTNRMHMMTLLAGMIGAISALFGAAASALAPRLPSGAMIVLVAAGVFAFSMLVGSARGLVPRFWRRRALQHTIGRQHFLRAAYEQLEPTQNWTATLTLDHLIPLRSWSRRQLRRIARRSEGAGRAVLNGNRIRLTRNGVEEARRLVRNHRLWEAYLVAHADVAPSHVDRDADMIEHVLGPEMIAELERLIIRDQSPRMPRSPHEIGGVSA